MRPTIAAILIFSCAGLGLLGVLSRMLWVYVGITLGSFGALDIFLGLVLTEYVFRLNVEYVKWGISGLFIILSVIGGVMAIRRKNWNLALMGGAASVLTGAGCCFSILPGIIAMILVVISKKEFK